MILANMRKLTTITIHHLRFSDLLVHTVLIFMTELEIHRHSSKLKVAMAYIMRTR